VTSCSSALVARWTTSPGAQRRGGTPRHPRRACPGAARPDHAAAFPRRSTDVPSRRTAARPAIGVITHVVNSTFLLGCAHLRPGRIRRTSRARRDGAALEILEPASTACCGRRAPGGGRRGVVAGPTHGRRHASTGRTFTSWCRNPRRHGAGESALARTARGFEVRPGHRARRRGPGRWRARGAGGTTEAPARGSCHRPARRGVLPRRRPAARRRPPRPTGQAARPRPSRRPAAFRGAARRALSALGPTRSAAFRGAGCAVRRAGAGAGSRAAQGICGRGPRRARRKPAARGRPGPPRRPRPRAPVAQAAGNTCRCRPGSGPMPRARGVATARPAGATSRTAGDARSQGRPGGPGGLTRATSWGAGRAGGVRPGDLVGAIPTRRDLW
jgi:hypothetical protein